jgi:hypothetical protein
MTIVQNLTMAFRELTRKQRERLRDHLRRGHPVACGRTAGYFVTSSGAG